MSTLAELIGQAGPPIGRTPQRLRDAPVTLKRERRVELEALLHIRDGFVAGEGALIMRPSMTVGAIRGIDDWNQLTLWRTPYRNAGELLFFAGNRFGREFALYRDEVVAFDPLTGNWEHLAFGLDRFAERAMEEPELLERSRYQAWVEEHGPLGTEQRLQPKVPPGFEPSDDTLRVVGDLDLMLMMARMFRETREHPGVLPAEHEAWWWSEE